MRKYVFSTVFGMLSVVSVSVFAADSININKADVAALDSLEGIGAKKAEAIVAWRTEHGEFKTLEDLKDVPGIGDKLFEKIQPSISLDGSTVAAEKTDTTQVDNKQKVAADNADTAQTDDKQKAVSAEKTESTPATSQKADKLSDKSGKSTPTS